MPRPYVLLSRVLFAFAIGTITFLALTGESVPIIRNVHDKIQHVAAFLGLALLLDFSFPDRPLNRWKVGALLAYGVTLELAQMATPSRDPALSDILADLAGILFYAGVLPALRRVPVLQLRWQGNRGDPR
ncbi:MAG TPA: VanZ family protein [Gemmatimonadales bacterium]|nr:VanZ family protein [Gemmatimonadales bacterium]